MAHQEKPQQHRQIRIEIDDQVADGTYANLAFVASNKSEFIFDFARFLPGNTRGKVVTRVVLGPDHAKNFLQSLTDSIKNYETKHGTISGTTADKNIGFKVDSGTESGDETG